MELVIIWWNYAGKKVSAEERRTDLPFICLDRLTLLSFQGRAESRAVLVHVLHKALAGVELDSADMHDTA